MNLNEQKSLKNLIMVKDEQSEFLELDPVTLVYRYDALLSNHLEANRIYKKS